MDRDQPTMEARLEEIRHLLSHLHGEVTALESSYTQVLSVLRKFEKAADTDDLTGLLRRRSFFQTWNTLLQECQRLNQACGVLMIDIDHFKHINDTHGHATGDEVIKRVAALLKQYESPSCVVSRLGGEEFAVALKGTDAEILGVAEFIRRSVEKLHGPVIGSDGKPSGKVEWKCTISAGMASSRSARSSGDANVEYDAHRLLRSADEALYEAKRKGRNQVRAHAA